MKNEKLKSLLARKAANVQLHSNEFELLNVDQLNYAHGGAASNCPMLTSCGTYDSNNCGLKVSLSAVSNNNA